VKLKDLAFITGVNHNAAAYYKCFKQTLRVLSMPMCEAQGFGFITGVNHDAAA
jgi:hypothetical protein